MAKETKAQMIARLQQKEEERQEELLRLYPERMMAALERATKLNWTISVNAGIFVVYDDRGEKYSFSKEYVESEFWEFEEFEYAMNAEERRRQEAEERANKIMAARAKLTKEELELLGLK